MTDFFILALAVFAAVVIARFLTASRLGRSDREPE